MYIDNGIAYAGEPVPPLSVVGVRSLEGYRLWVRFSSGETRVFDFRSLLGTPAFAPLADERFFSAVGIDYGVPVWNDGEIDIAPETLYRDGAIAENEHKEAAKC
jgi:hypothetical protein